MSVKRKAKRIVTEQKQVYGSNTIPQKGFGTDMPPKKPLVEIYFDQKGFAALAAEFYHYYEKAGWCSPRGTPYRNWKLLAGDWIFNHEQEQKLRKRQRENMLAS